MKTDARRATPVHPDNDVCKYFSFLCGKIIKHALEVATTKEMEKIFETVITKKLRWKHKETMLLRKNKNEQKKILSSVSK